MVQANMHEAKSKLSQLAEIAANGEKVVIAKAGKPYVDIVPHVESIVREPGGSHVEFKSFDDADEEIEAMFISSAH